MARIPPASQVLAAVSGALFAGVVAVALVGFRPPAPAGESFTVEALDAEHSVVRATGGRAANRDSSADDRLLTGSLDWDDAGCLTLGTPTGRWLVGSTYAQFAVGRHGRLLIDGYTIRLPETREFLGRTIAAPPAVVGRTGSCAPSLGVVILGHG